MMKEWMLHDYNTSALDWHNEFSMLKEQVLCDDYSLIIEWVFYDAG